MRVCVDCASLTYNTRCKPCERKRRRRSAPLN
jgi:hypothetical protein